MSDAPKTITTFALDGVLRDFPVSFDYLSRSFVAVTLIGVSRTPLVMNVDYRFTGPRQITLTTSQGSPNAFIEIRRLTNATSRIVSFNDGSVLTANDLNISQLQALHVAEEARDMTTLGIGLDQLTIAAVAVAKFLGPKPTNPSTRNDGSPLQYGDRYENTTTNMELTYRGGAWVVNNLDGTLIQSTGGSATVGHSADGSGGFRRTVWSKLSDKVSIKDFGAIGDGTVHPVSEWYTPGFSAYRGYANLAAVQVHYPHVTSGSQSIDWAATQLAVNLRSLVDAPEGVYMFSDRVIIPDFHGIAGSGHGYFFDHSNKFIFTGTGAKSNVAAGLVETSVANPDAGGAYLADSGTRGNVYKILDYTIPFSAAVILGKGSFVYDLGVYPNFDVTAGYAGSDGRLSDNWDVGVWARNSDRWKLGGVVVAGHWRKSALHITATDIGDGKVPSNELGTARECTFQGFRGITGRSPETGGGTNYGFAGTRFIDCVVRPLNHQSARLATSSFLETPFDSPSACVELSGETMRGIQFIGCTFIGRDDINMIFGRTSEILFTSCYEESKAVIVNGVWLANSLGSRMVATSNTVGVKFAENSKYGVDFSPLQTRDSSLVGQRYVNPGVFTPNNGYDDDYSKRIFGSYTGERLRTSSDRFIFSDYLDATIVTVDLVGLASKHYKGLETASVGDDQVISVPTPRNGGHAFITYLGGTDVDGVFPLVSASGAVIYDTGSSPSCTLGYGGGQFAAVTTDVSGTTGTDGKVTIGVIAGNLRIENRSGGSTRFRVTFMS